MMFFLADLQVVFYTEESDTDMLYIVLFAFEKD